LRHSEISRRNRRRQPAAGQSAGSAAEYCSVVAAGAMRIIVLRTFSRGLQARDACLMKFACASDKEILIVEPGIVAAPRWAVV